MRAILFILVLAGALAVAVAAIGLQPAASGIAHAGVTAAGLRADDLRVIVAADPPTELVELHADTIRITASDATWGEARIGDLALLLEDVAISSLRAAHVDGRLEDVRFVHDDTDGTAGGERGALVVGLITLGGGAEGISAVAMIDAATMEGHIAARVREQTGLEPSEVIMSAPDRLRIELTGLAVDGQIAPGPDGGLVLVPDGGPIGEITLVEAGSQPIRFTKAYVVGRTLRLVGELQLVGG